MNQQNHDSRRSHRFPPNTFLEHSFQVSRGHPPRSNQPFRPLPEPTGPPPYHLSLEQVLPAEHIQDINNSKRLVFHVVGDTGGVKAPQPQQIVAIQMAYDFKSSDL